MNLQEKEALTSELKEIVQTAKAFVLISHAGLTVEEMTKLRKDLKEQDSRLKVIKNTLFGRAISGTPLEGLATQLKGPLGVVWTEKDPSAMAKTLLGFAKATPKIAVVAGAMGKSTISPEDVQTLAKLPPIEQVKGMFLGILLAVPQKFLGLLQTPARQFLGVLVARKNSLENKG
jgi:large subunit ribosomal protein L10